MMLRNRFVIKLSALVAALALLAIQVSLIPVYAQDSTMTVTAFAILREEVRKRMVPHGTVQDALNLPQCWGQARSRCPEKAARRL